MPSLPHFVLLFLPFLMPLSVAMICYNSQAVNPSRESICEPQEICFGEYYAMRQSADDGSLSHFFDRFCVHSQHCISRGFWPEGRGRACLQLNELDTVVAQTFRNKLISERLDPNRLLYTRFCCCSDKNLCNKMSGREIGKLFNVTITVPQHQTLINRERVGRHGVRRNGPTGGGQQLQWRTMQIMAMTLMALYQRHNGNRTA